jgi:anti-sigma regulatory factor (Ser/Thr protein kinase)
MTPETVTIELRNELSELGRLARQVKELAGLWQAPEAALGDIDLALEEIVSNIIRHGYTDQGQHPIQLEFRRTPDGLVATVVDDGKPFNPLNRPDPDVTLPLEERPIGGLGIFLVRRLMDAVSYERRGGQNVLTLTKRFPR